MRLIKQLLAVLVLLFAVNSTLFAAKYSETPYGMMLQGSDPASVDDGFGFLYGKDDGDLYWLDSVGGLPRNILLGGSTSLNSLTDVDTTGVTGGQVLTYDGSEWLPQDSAGGVGKWVTGFAYFTDDVIWNVTDSKFYVALADHTSGVFITDRDTNGYWLELSAGLSSVLADGKIIVGSVANLEAPVSMSGEASIINTGAITLSNSAVIGKVLTGHTAGAGTVAATDTIAEAIEKLDGNDLGNLKLDQTTPQSVVNGAPIFDQIDTNTAIANPTHNEGKVFYDNTKNALSYYNEEADITVNLGQELLLLVCNNSGSTIANGAVVYPNAVTGIALASNIEKLKSRLVAVATHSIEDGTCGYATKVGQVGGLNTSAFSVGDILYLNNNGGYTTTRPNDGAYAVIIGVVDVDDAVNGIITVDIVGNDLTVEVTDTNGFPETERTGTVMTVTGVGPYSFNIAPTGTDFHFYVLGEKFEKTTTQSVTFPDSEGEHWFYFDATGTLATIFEPTTAQRKQIILDYAFAGYIYWNATANAIVGDIFDERHGISMSPVTHAYLHTTRGAQFLSGLGLDDFVISSGNSATHAQFSVASGVIMDEDLAHEQASNIAVGTTIPVLYLTGASTNPSLREGSTAGFAILTTGTGRLAYNQNNAGTWQLTEVPNGNYVLYHLFAVNGQDDIVFSVMGQSQYTSSTSARNAAATEIGNIIAGFEMSEAVPLGTVIFQTQDTYTNSVNARVIEAVSGGADYTDWRTTELAQGVAPSSHNNLTNVELAGTGVTQGHIDDQAQTIYGAKTFNGAISASNLSGTNTGDQVVLTANQNERVKDIEYVNYVKGFDSNAEGALAGGWVLYDQGDVARPTTGSTGTPTVVTFGRHTATPLLNTGDFEFVKSNAGSARGEGVAYAFTVQKAHQTQMLEVTFEYDTSSANYSCDYTVTPSLCDVGVYSYDGTNAYWIGDLPAGKGTFSGTFQVDSTNTHRIIFHVQSTDATAYTLYFDDIVVKPQAPSVKGSFDRYIGSFTPVTTWGNSVTGVAKYWQRGDKLFAEIQFTVNNQTSFPIPSATSLDITNTYPIDYNKLALTSQVMNSDVKFFDSGANWYFGGGVRAVDISTLRVYTAGITQNGSDGATKTAPIAWAEGDTILVTYEFPVVGWSSNMVLSSSTSNRETYLKVTRDTSGQAAASNTVTKIQYNGTPTIKGNISWDNVNYKATINEDGLYSITPKTTVIPDSATTANIRIVGTNPVIDLYTAIPSTLSGTYGTPIEIYLTKGQTIEIYIMFIGVGGTVVSSGTAPDFTTLTITKLNTGSQTIAKDAMVFESYDTSASEITASGTYTAGVNVYTNKLYSTHGSYNTTTGIFTAPRDGIYEFCAAARSDATIGINNAFLWLVGGDGDPSGLKSMNMLSARNVYRQHGCRTAYAAKGAQLWVKNQHLGAVGAQFLNGLAPSNWITIRSLD